MSVCSGRSITRDRSIYLQGDDEIFRSPQGAFGASTKALLFSFLNHGLQRFSSLASDCRRGEQPLSPLWRWHKTQPTISQMCIRKLSCSRGYERDIRVTSLATIAAFNTLRLGIARFDPRLHHNFLISESSSRGFLNVISTTSPSPQK